MIPQRLRSQLLALAALWGIVRAWPLARCVPETLWEIWEADKLLEYGFWARKGAFIECHFGGGLLPDPSLFNYTNHPYLPLWIYTGICALVGPWGIILANALLGLVVTLLVLLALRELFDARAAFLAAALYALAPSAILFDVNPNTVALGASFWPLAAFFLHRATAEPLRRRWRWSLGAVFLAAGLTNWFALTLVAPFVVWVGGSNLPARDRTRIAAFILGGALVAAVLFALQVVAYSPDLVHLREYAGAQAAMGDRASPRGTLLRTVLMRSVVMVGPALLLGLATGLFAAFRVSCNRRRDAWIYACLAYLGTWACAAAVLARFFQRERHMYEYLLFPGALLSAAAIGRLSSRVLRPALLCAALLGALYPQVQASIVQISEASLRIGGMLREKTLSTAVVLSNLTDKAPPFEPWDVGCWAFTSVVADRTLWLETRDLPAFERATRAFKDRPPDFVFLLEKGQPVEPSFREWLRARATRVERTSVTIPAQSPGAAVPLRNLYWRIMGQGRRAPQPSPVALRDRTAEFELYFLPAQVAKLSP